MMMTEMVIAMVIVVIALFPLGFSALSDGKLFKVSYQKAVAMEIVDGEMEILAAGDWRNFPEGTNVYTVHANAATNLPPGNFVLTRSGQHLRLEWKSEKKHGIGPVFREVTVK
jgi:hypothetical protein